MRTDEERIAALHSRAAEIIYKKRKLQTRIAGAAGAVVCLALMIFLAIRMASVSADFETTPVNASMTASIFSDNSVLSYIVIAVIAFLLGICITIFCFWLKKWRDSASSNAGRPKEQAKDEEHL